MTPIAPTTTVSRAVERMVDAGVKRRLAVRLILASARRGGDPLTAADQYIRSQGLDYDV